MDLDKQALDRYITGNYGEDQFRDWPDCYSQNCPEPATHQLVDVNSTRFYCLEHAQTIAAVARGATEMREIDPDSLYVPTPEEIDPPIKRQVGEEQLRGWLCTCANQYAGVMTAQLYDVEPSQSDCHRMACGWISWRWEDSPAPFSGPLEPVNDKSAAYYHWLLALASERAMGSSDARRLHDSDFCDRCGSGEQTWNELGKPSIYKELQRLRAEGV